ESSRVRLMVYGPLPSVRPSSSSSAEPGTAVRRRRTDRGPRLGGATGGDVGCPPLVGAVGAAVGGGRAGWGVGGGRRGARGGAGAGGAAGGDGDGLAGTDAVGLAVADADGLADGDGRGTMGVGPGGVFSPASSSSLCAGTCPRLVSPPRKSTAAATPANTSAA